ncbi:hypothetical protein ABZ896_03325 [Streptomyces sp. NPDC047072]|uniref:hypothetical protein n=1 Tax=Streptomyces sp. NPDC047072 TaxID=3154809 RepID=UPI0033DD333F
MGGAAQLGGFTEPLPLGALRLELDGDSGALHARTAVEGQARELALADVSSEGAGPVVRKSGVTWTGLRASLTEEGARLLTAWSGREFAPGADLGVLDVTVGTGTSARPEDEPAQTSQPAPTAAPVVRSAPSASVTLDSLPAGGGQQTVTGADFERGEVVLVTIDADTRYQAVADAEGRVAQAFPVYATAAEGEHTVELRSVGGERGAITRFTVR